MNNNFIDDEEKMKDFFELSKDEFLENYSYLTKEEYDNTKQLAMLNEAIERMKLLNLHENTIKEIKQGVLNKSENMGALYWLDEEENKKVKEFEKEYNAKVYHVIHHFSEFGECYCYLYVGEDVSTWEVDKEDLKNGEAFVYVYNKDDDWCSEFGAIGIEPCFGGLIRRF